MNEKELQSAIRNSGISATEIIEKTGIKRTTFYTLYKEEEVEQHYIDKIASAGVVFQTPEQNRTSKESLEYLKAENFMYLSGMPLKVIQILGGWKSIKQLERYIKIDKMQNAMKASEHDFFKNK